MGGSGRLGGESGALTSVLTAREMAGLAAAQRKTEEEQAIEDACPSGRGALAVHARPHDAASPVVELGKQETEVVEAPATAAAVASAEEQQGGSGLDVDVTNDDDLSPPPHSCCRDAGHGHAHAAAPASPPPPPPPPAGTAEDEAPVEQLLALGFAREAVVGALRWAGGDVQRAANHLVASGGVLGTEPAPAALPVDADLPVDPSTREGRVLLAARKLFREEARGDPAGRADALSTLRTMIQAVLVSTCGLCARWIIIILVLTPHLPLTTTGPPRRGQVQARTASQCQVPAGGRAARVGARAAASDWVRGADHARGRGRTAADAQRRGAPLARQGGARGGGGDRDGGRRGQARASVIVVCLVWIA